MREERTQHHSGLLGLPATKSCSDCKKEKLGDDFFPRKLPGRKLSYSSQCRECLKVRSRRWRQKNREYHRASVQQWKAGNAERRRATEDRWRSANREKITGYHRSHHAKHRVRRNASMRESARFDREQISQSYAKHQLVSRSSLRTADLPADLVTLKQAQLRLSRALKTPIMKTAADWVKEIEALYEGQKNGDIMPPQAVEMNNTIGKLISLTKLQLEYNKVRKELGSKKMRIALLERSKKKSH